MTWLLPYLDEASQRSRKQQIAIILARKKSGHRVLADLTKTAAPLGGGNYLQSFAKNGKHSGDVWLELHPQTDGVRVSLIKVPPKYRGKGLAKAALKRLTELADTHGATLSGVVSPMDRSTKISKLYKLYAQFGFVRIKYAGKMSDEISRSPRKS